MNPFAYNPENDVPIYGLGGGYVVDKGNSRARFGSLSEAENYADAFGRGGFGTPLPMTDDLQSMVMRRQMQSLGLMPMMEPQKPQGLLGGLLSDYGLQLLQLLPAIAAARKK